MQKQTGGQEKGRADASVFIAFPIWYLILFAVIWIVCGKWWIALLALLAMVIVLNIVHAF